MDLGHRGRRQRFVLEVGEQQAQRLAQRGFHQGREVVAGKGWHAVLQPIQFGAEIGGDQVRACREHLPEFHEYRAQGFQGQAQALPAWASWARQQPQQGERQAQGERQTQILGQGVEAVVQHYPGDIQRPPRPLHAPCRPGSVMPAGRTGPRFITEARLIADA